jgi:hypothetical protein
MAALAEMMRLVLLTLIGTAVVMLILSVTGCGPARDRTDWKALAQGVGQVEKR